MGGGAGRELARVKLGLAPIQVYPCAGIVVRYGVDIPADRLLDQMIDKQVFKHAQIIDREPDLLDQFARIIAPAVRDGDQHRTARNAPRLHERLGWVFDIYRAGLAGNRRVKLRQSGLSANAVATRSEEHTSALPS